MRIVLFLLLLISTVTSSFADETRVTTSFDKQAAQVGEEIHLAIRVSGAQGNIQAPQIPALKNFDTFYTGRASRVTFINGVSDSSVEFNYVLVPKDAGNYTLSPIEVVVNGQRFTTSPAQIQISGSGAPQPSPLRQYQQRMPYQQPAQQQQQSSAPSSSPPTQEPPMNYKPEDDNIFVRAWTDKTSVYPNEQILLTYSLYTRMDTRYEGFDQEPQVSGFWIEDFPMEREISKQTVTMNGKRYIKAEVKKMALFPTAPADYTIQPGTLKASVRQEPEAGSVFDDFFNDSFFSGGSFFARRENRLLKPAPIQIHVKPFPAAGKPDSFQDAVGQFQMTATVDKTTVKQNEPVTLKMVIEGQGNIETLTKPKTPELVNFKIYDSDTSSQLFKTGDVIGGRKNFEIVFIPTQARTSKIPKIEFSYFNPATASYVRLFTPEFVLNVIPSDQPFKLPDSLSQQDQFKKDILAEKDIRYIREKISDEKSRGVFNAALIGLGAANVLLTLLVGVGMMKRREDMIFLANSGLKRRKMARPRAEARIRNLKKKNKSDLEYFEEIEKILNQYLSDKFNLSAHGATREELESHLHQTLGPQDPLFNDIVELYEICEASRFARADAPAEAKSQALQILNQAIARVEKMRH